MGADLVVNATRRLSMRDLAVLAAAAERLPPEGKPDAPMTLYRLGQAVYGRPPDGRDRRQLYESLERLSSITLDLPGYDITTNRIVGLMGGSRWVSLVEGVYVEHQRLRLVTPQELGALKGQVNLRVRFALWYADQIRAGYVTYLDLATFRALGGGLAARVWAFLEAEQFDPKGDDIETKALGLGEPMLQALGLNRYGRSQDARVRLRRGCARIVAQDARYELLEVRRGPMGWDLYAVRRAGERLQEHRHVRQLARRSLFDLDA
jgi:hypothetical protein